MVGDVIAFQRDGRVWVLEIRDTPESGTGWALMCTDDFADYKDHGVKRPSGGPAADNFNSYTGSVVDDRSPGFQFHAECSSWALHAAGV